MPGWGEILPKVFGKGEGKAAEGEGAAARGGKGKGEAETKPKTAEEEAAEKKAAEEARTKAANEAKLAIEKQEAEGALKADKARATDVQNGMKEGQEAAQEEIKAGSPSKLKELGKAAWTNAVAFGKWLGVQIASAAIMAVVMDKVESILEGGSKPKSGDDNSSTTSGSGTGGSTGTTGTTGSTGTTGTTGTTTTPTVSADEAAKALAAFKAVNAAQKRSTTITNAWLTWLSTNFDKQDDYDKSSDSDSINYLVILQSNIFNLGKFLEDNVAVATNLVFENRTLASTKSLLEKALEYHKKVETLATTIDSKYPLMVKGGLVSQHAEATAIVKTVTDAKTTAEAASTTTTTTTTT